MKKLITILFLLISCSVFATNYYVKTAGSNSNTGRGRSDAEAWATLTRVNTAWAMGMFNAGDSILFNRGDTFYGTITVKESGSTENPIVLGAYGTGTDPVISGFTTIPSWTALNDSVYYYDITCESATNNLITVNGANTPMGRWPNTGWMTYESHSGDASITDNELTNTPNWTGAELVLRRTWWSLIRNPITDHTNTVITYTAVNPWDGPTNGYGYFIQKDIKTLDDLGDWYYDGTTLFMYFGVADPTDYTVKISTLDKLLSSGVAASTYYNYITVDNISFEGSSIQTIELVANTHHWTIQNCNFNYSGKNCIDGWQIVHHITITNNIINNTNNNAIRSIYRGYANTVSYNTISNTGVLIGMMYSDDDSGDAIVLKDDNIPNGTIDTVMYNRITNTGHSGIRVRYGGYNVSYNYINTFALTKNDAGGFYSYNANTITLQSNIILNGYGESGGILSKPDYAPPDPFFVCVIGIYLDDITTSINILDNTTANNRDGGMLIQRSTTITVTGNTSYNNGYYQIGLSQESAASYPVRDVIMNNNIFFAKSSGRALFPYMQLCLFASTYEDHDINEFGTFDYNYYARPIDQDDVFRTYEHKPYSPWNGTGYTLAGWKTYSGQDAHSTGSLGTAISDTADIHFIYNDTKVNKTFILSAGMTDVANTSYSGNIIVASYSSLILLGKGTIIEIFPKKPINPDENSELFNLLPNPNNGRFSIELLTSLKNEKNMVTIVNITGEIVYKGILSKKENTRQFDLSYLNSGIYILLITSDKIISTKKFIKI